MNTPLLHRPSFLGGALFSGLLLLGLGASSVAPQIMSVLVRNEVEVKGIPHASEMLRIVEGTPYMVPVGKILVITGAVVGNPVTPSPLAYTIIIDGVPSVYSNDSYISGYTVQAGSIVEIDDTGDSGFPGSPEYQGTLLAYLEDA